MELVFLSDRCAVFYHRHCGSSLCKARKPDLASARYSVAMSDVCGRLYGHRLLDFARRVRSRLVSSQSRTGSMAVVFHWGAGDRSGAGPRTTFARRPIYPGRCAPMTALFSVMPVSRSPNAIGHLGCVRRFGRTAGSIQSCRRAASASLGRTSPTTVIGCLWPSDGLYGILQIGAGPIGAQVTRRSPSSQAPPTFPRVVTSSVSMDLQKPWSQWQNFRVYKRPNIIVRIKSTNNSVYVDSR